MGCSVKLEPRTSAYSGRGTVYDCSGTVGEPHVTMLDSRAASKASGKRDISGARRDPFLSSPPSQTPVVRPIHVSGRVAVSALLQRDAGPCRVPHRAAPRSARHELGLTPVADDTGARAVALATTSPPPLPGCLCLIHPVGGAAAGGGGHRLFHPPFFCTRPSARPDARGPAFLRCLALSC